MAPSSKKSTMSNDDDDENDVPPLSTTCTRRSSGRDTNKIRLSPGALGALQHRRLEQLFFEQDEDDGNDANDTLQLGKFSLKQVYQAPNIYVIDNFLTATELEYFATYINRMQSSESFEQSFVDSSTSTETLLDDTHRTSTFLSIPKQENRTICNLESRAANLLGCYSTDTVEPLQLVRYREGQFFGVHHDMGDFDEDNGRVALPPKTVLAKRRIVTIFVYLNTLPKEAGGATWFPECDNLRVRPKAGRAVIFPNITREGLPDPRTIHAGEKVKKVSKTKKSKKKKKKKRKTSHNGSSVDSSTNSNPQPTVKYGLNIWLCES